MARSGGARRLARHGIVLTAVLLLAGCGAGGTPVTANATPTPTSSPTPQPMADLGSSQSMAGMGGTAGMGGMAATPPTETADSAATGAPVPASVLQAIATSVDSVPGVSYTFAVSGSDMMSPWPSGKGVISGGPTPGLDAQIQRMMSMGYNSGSMQFRAIGDQLWVRSARYDQGKAWVLVPADESTNPQSVGMHRQVDQLDPRLALKLLQASGNVHVTTLGTTLLSTTHYVGEVTGAQLASASSLSATTRAELAEVYPSLSIRPLSVDVWVDAAQHPVRLEVISPTPEGALQMEMDFTGYGTPAAVVAPAADETIPLPADS